MDIASPWDHRVYEKEGEKIEKYQDFKSEIGSLWGFRHLEVVPVVVGALEVVSNRFCLLYTSPSPRDGLLSRMPSSA